MESSHTTQGNENIDLTDGIELVQVGGRPLSCTFEEPVYRETTTRCPLARSGPPGRNVKLFCFAASCFLTILTFISLGLVSLDEEQEGVRALVDFVSYFQVQHELQAASNNTTATRRG